MYLSNGIGKDLLILDELPGITDFSPAPIHLEHTSRFGPLWVSGGVPVRRQLAKERGF